MLSSDFGGDKSEPRSRRLPQSDAGGSRNRTTAKEPVVRRRKKATRVQGPREEHAQQKVKIKKNRKSKANSRQD